MARTLGAKNKVPQEAKENIHAVFVKLGSTTRMAKWAEDNLTDFYKIYARLLPVEGKMVGPGVDGEHKLEITWSQK